MVATCIKQKVIDKLSVHGTKIQKNIYSYLCRLLFLDYCLQNRVYIYTSKSQSSPHITYFQHTSLGRHTHSSLDRGNGIEKVITKNKTNISQVINDHGYIANFLQGKKKYFSCLIQEYNNIPELLDSGCKSWTLDAGLWTQDAGLWTLDTRPWALDSGGYRNSQNV